MNPGPKYLSQPEDWLTYQPDRELRNYVFQWTQTRLGADDVPAIPVEDEHGRLAYESLVDDLPIAVVWGMSPSGRVIVIFIKTLP